MIICGTFFVIIIGKDSARQLVVSQDVNTDETKLVNSPDKAKKSDIPLTMSDHSKIIHSIILIR